jgi:hypothetical protein
MSNRTNSNKKWELNLTDKKKLKEDDIELFFEFYKLFQIK